MPDTSNDLGLAEARTAAPTLHRTLAAGAGGHDVARLQAELRTAGLTPGAIDGIFGDRTTTAVIAFATREDLTPVDGTVDVALWSAILAAGARARADALEAAARAHEQAADAAHDAAGAAQQLAVDQRSKAIPAGPDEEGAADRLILAAQHWRAAAAQWLAVAEVLAPHADPEGRSYKAHARHWNALDQARAHAKRTVNSLALAGKDFDTAGVTDHRERLARATLAARDLAAT